MENRKLKSQRDEGLHFGRLIGDSPAMLEVYEMIHRISRSHINCIILGASGTGKEMVARAIHENGLRAERPFVTINCGAIPENLVESELFGHVKGSFTSAFRDKLGLLEVANHGTIFFDEIDALPLSTQVKLLRAIQEKQVMPVGSVTPVDIDTRILCASNADMEELVQQGLFRRPVLSLEWWSCTSFVKGSTGDMDLPIQHFIQRCSQEYGAHWVYRLML